tara:strand:+ start:564 stop:800 length:237 start_codon:yes stop_codon:yes gene_type:complete
MKIGNEPDPHKHFKVNFVKIVQNYIDDPTNKKQTKLKEIVRDAIEVDADLLFWFNVMFRWSNTPNGLHVDFRNKPESP